MSDVKWIKITTDIFNDEKMMLIESMPDSDSLIVIWFKLLALAGKSNNGGLVMISDKVPYTKEMLVTLFRRKQTVVDLALHTFEQFEMIQLLDDDTILISNWEKHQNIKGLDDIREKNRLRQQKYRDNHKLLIEKKNKEQDLETDRKSNVTNNVTNYTLVVDVWNSLGFKKVAKLTDKRKRHLKARIKDYTYEVVLSTIKSLKDVKFFKDNKGSNWFDFDWVLNPNNFVKIYEGKYKNSSNGKHEPDWLDDVMKEF